jgi:hypothetical protein
MGGVLLAADEVGEVPATAGAGASFSTLFSRYCWTAHTMSGATTAPKTAARTSTRRPLDFFSSPFFASTDMAGPATKLRDPKEREAVVRTEFDEVAATLADVPDLEGLRLYLENPVLPGEPLSLWVHETMAAPTLVGTAWGTGSP